MEKIPEIGIVILVRDALDPIVAEQRARLLDQSLNILLRQEIDTTYQIHCGHYGPGDYSLSILEALPIVVHHLSYEDFAFGKSRDEMFAACPCPILVTLSADVIPASKFWLQSLTFPIRNGQADVVQGSFTTPPGWDDFYWELDGWFWFTSEWCGFCRKNGDIALSCGNLAISRGAWEATGFYGTPFCEDKVIQVRLAHKGFRMQFSDQALAYHAHSFDLKNLWLRTSNEGLGWRHVKVSYGLLKCVADATASRVWGRWLQGILRKKIRTWAELLFPLVRPLAMWYGNRLATDVSEYNGNSERA